MSPAEPSPGELGRYDPEHVGRHAPAWRRALHRYFRASVHGLEWLPEGPFVAVGNHSGAALMPDTLVWLSEVHSLGRDTPLLTLAHDAIFDRYPRAVAEFAARYGAIRSRRELALQALRSGCAVQIYPGGDHDACRPFRRRNQLVFAGRTGYVDLARQAGVPIVPVASVGGHEALIVLREGRRLARALGLDRKLRLGAFPLSLSLPWGLWLGPLPGYLPLPTRIEVRVLPPLSAERETEIVDATVRHALQAAIERMAARRRLPILG